MPTLDAVDVVMLAPHKTNDPIHCSNGTTDGRHILEVVHVLAAHLLLKRLYDDRDARVDHRTAPDAGLPHYPPPGRRRTLLTNAECYLIFLHGTLCIYLLN